MSSSSSKIFSVADRVKQYMITPKYGLSLKAILATGHKLSEADVCYLGLKLIDAMEYIHGKGVVYNNLSLSHILIGDH